MSEGEERKLSGQIDTLHENLFATFVMHSCYSAVQL